MTERIEDYALIGDTRSSALVHRSGSIDWMCIPRFDSAPVFNRLLDKHQGGHFSVSCVGAHASDRRYDGTTLVTSWRGTTGTLEVRDTMVTGLGTALLPTSLLVRNLTCTHGTVEATIELKPRLGMPGTAPRVAVSESAVRCEWGRTAIAVTSDLGIPLHPEIPLRVSLSEGDSRIVAMSVADKEPLVLVHPTEAAELAAHDVAWWTGWSDSLEYEGPDRDAVVRSLITMRLLTYSPSGAPVAAPTTSLPEWIGGERNWDYRYAWPRDASIGIRGFLNAGQPDVAQAFMRWLLHAARVSRPRIEVVYTLDGNPVPDEFEADVPGFLDSAPVRVGNAAKDQIQLDVYGWVLDAVHRLIESGQRINAETARATSAAADLVVQQWQAPDNGLWEVRGEQKHYVHSKMMCWLALDSAAKSRSVFGEKKAQEWMKARDAIASSIRSEGFDASRNVYLRSYGSADLDAAILLPLTEFEKDPDIVNATIDVVTKELSAGGPLLYRYTSEDSLRGPEGAFLPCSFWLVHALARSGRADEAEEIFLELCSLSNDVGLFPEEMEPGSHRFLGNFPQALTHGSLVLAAQAIAGAKGDARTFPR